MKAMSSTKSELAIPFISYSEKQGFTLNPQAEQFIRQIPENKKIGVISIVGKYRTGKSFFVNRVLLNSRKSGFQVGPTINPCTKGLWMWKKTLQSTNPQHQNMETILIDTQGFGGTDQNANHDSRIFLFSLLLSSYFIYNSTGSIDENALNTLNLIINLAKQIQSKAGNKSQQLPNNFPAFLWVVRDFTLQLVDKYGNKVNSKQYLQNALEIQKGITDSIQNKNKIRRAFKHFFQDRDCMTMVRPTERQKDLQRLDQIDNAELRPQFITQVQAVRKKIFTRIKPKTIHNKILNGSMFVQLIKGYLEAINKGALPTIQNAWVYISRNEGLKAVSDSIKNLQRKIQELSKDNPIQQKNIQILQKKYQQQTIIQFKSKSMGCQQGNPDIIQTLKKKIVSIFSDFVQRNKKNWIYKYKQSSDKAVITIKDKLFNDEYLTYQQFINDFNRLKKEYEQTTGSSTQKWIYFNEISQQIHRLAGQTISIRIENSLKIQNKLLQQKLKLQQQQFQSKKQQYTEQRTDLRNRLQQIQRKYARISGTQQYNQQRIKQLKHNKQQLQQKYNKLQQQNNNRYIQLQKLKNQILKNNEIQLQKLKEELNILKLQNQKQKKIIQMQKVYTEKQIQSYKQKIEYVQNQNKKYKVCINQYKIELQNKNLIIQEKQIQLKNLIQNNQLLNKKNQMLMNQNYQKNSQIVKQHNQWNVQKTYMENQILFLRNTLNQNKRLHDALVQALQQAVNSTESDKQNQLVQTNKNLASALQKLQARCKILQEKQQKLKRFKKIVKNCTALQCLHCSKWIANTIFPQHLANCCQNHIGKQIQRVNTKQNPSNLNDAAGLNIMISQTLGKQTEQNNLFTQYLIQISLHNKKWSVQRKFKNFCQLHQTLIHLFPTVKFAQSFNALNNIQNDLNQMLTTKRTVIVQQRRKSLQLFMRDLSKMQIIRNCKSFRDFLKLDENLQQKQGQQKNESQQKSLIDQKQINSSKKQLLYKALFNNSKQRLLK